VATTRAPELADLIDAIAPAPPGIAELVASLSPAPISEDAATAELWEQVAQQPRDLGVRSVLADALVARNDSRGELIALQQVDSPSTRNRAASPCSWRDSTRSLHPSHERDARQANRAADSPVRDPTATDGGVELFRREARRPGPNVATPVRSAVSAIAISSGAIA
jgi:hypothetical protein